MLLWGCTGSDAGMLGALGWLRMPCAGVIGCTVGGGFMVALGENAGGGWIGAIGDPLALGLAPELAPMGRAMLEGGNAVVAAEEAPVLKAV